LEISHHEVGGIVTKRVDVMTQLLGSGPSFKEQGERQGLGASPECSSVK
jgi:hypothetical protein